MDFRGICSKIDVDAIRAKLPPMVTQMKLPKSMSKLRSRKIFRSSREDVNAETQRSSSKKSQYSDTTAPASDFVDHTPQRISTISSLVDEEPGQGRGASRGRRRPEHEDENFYRSAGGIEDYCPSPPGDRRLSKPLSLPGHGPMSPGRRTASEQNVKMSIVERVQKGYKDVSEFRLKHIFAKKTVVRQDSIQVADYVQGFEEERRRHERAEERRDRAIAENYDFDFKLSRRKSEESFGVSTPRGSQENLPRKTLSELSGDESGMELSPPARKPGIAATRFSRVREVPLQMSIDEDEDTNRAEDVELQPQPIESALYNKRAKRNEAERESSRTLLNKSKSIKKPLGDAKNISLEESLSLSSGSPRKRQERELYNNLNKQNEDEPQRASSQPPQRSKSKSIKKMFENLRNISQEESLSLSSGSPKKRKQNELYNKLNKRNQVEQVEEEEESVPRPRSRPKSIKKILGNLRNISQEESLSLSSGGSPKKRKENEFHNKLNKVNEMETVSPPPRPQLPKARSIKKPLGNLRNISVEESLSLSSGSPKKRKEANLYNNLNKRKELEGEASQPPRSKTRSIKKILGNLRNISQEESLSLSSGSPKKRNENDFYNKLQKVNEVEPESPPRPPPPKARNIKKPLNKFVSHEESLSLSSGPETTDYYNKLNKFKEVDPETPPRPPPPQLPKARRNLNKDGSLEESLSLSSGPSPTKRMDIDFYNQLNKVNEFEPAESPPRQRKLSKSRSIKKHLDDLKHISQEESLSLSSGSPMKRKAAPPMRPQQSEEDQQMFTPPVGSPAHIAPTEKPAGGGGIKENFRRFQKSMKLRATSSGGESEMDESNADGKSKQSKTQQFAERIKRFRSVENVNKQGEDDEPEPDHSNKVGQESPLHRWANKLQDWKMSFKNKPSDTQITDDDEVTSPRNCDKRATLIRKLQYIRNRKQNNSVDDPDDDEEGGATYKESFKSRAKLQLEKGVAAATQMPQMTIEKFKESKKYFRKKQDKDKDNEKEKEKERVPPPTKKPAESEESALEDDAEDEEMTQLPKHTKPPAKSRLYYTSDDEDDDDNRPTKVTLEPYQQNVLVPLSRAAWSVKPILTDSTGEEDDDDENLPRVLIHQDNSDVFESTLIIAVTRPIPRSQTTSPYITELPNDSPYASPKESPFVSPIESPSDSPKASTPETKADHWQPNREIISSSMEGTSPPTQRKLSKDSILSGHSRKHSLESSSEDSWIKDVPRGPSTAVGLNRVYESEEPWEVQRDKTEEKLHKTKSIDIFVIHNKPGEDSEIFEDFDDELKNMPVVSIDKKEVHESFDHDDDSGEEMDNPDDDNSSRVTKILKQVDEDTQAKVKIEVTQPDGKIEETAKKEKIEETQAKEKIEETQTKEKFQENQMIEKIEETQVKAVETKPKEQVEETQPKVKIEETQPKVQIEETQSKAKNEETQPKVQIEETQSKAKNEETQPTSKVDEKESKSKIEHSQPTAKIEEPKPNPELKSHLYANSREGPMGNLVQNGDAGGKVNADVDDNDRPPSSTPSPPPSMSPPPPPLPQRKASLGLAKLEEELPTITTAVTQTKPPPTIPERQASVAKTKPRPLVKTASLRLAYSEQVNPEDVGKVNKLISRFETNGRPRVIPRNPYLYQSSAEYSDHEVEEVADNKEDDVEKEIQTLNDINANIVIPSRNIWTVKTEEAATIASAAAIRNPEPVQEPVETVKEKGEPVKEPLESVQEPVKPAKEPENPVKEPVKVMQEPVKPVTEPVEVMKEPVEVVKEPVEVVKEPVEVVKEPVEVLKEPVEVVKEPVEVVKEPVEVMKEPVEVVKEPVKPVEVVKEPVEVVKEPVEVVKGPVEVVKEPVEVVKEPVKPVKEPVEPAKEPLKPLEEPAKEPVKPLEEAGKPVKEPVKHVKQPVEPVEEPVKLTQSSPPNNNKKPDPVKEPVERVQSSPPTHNNNNPELEKEPVRPVQSSPPTKNNNNPEPVKEPVRPVQSSPPTKNNNNPEPVKEPVRPVQSSPPNNNNNNSETSNNNNNTESEKDRKTNQAAAPTSIYSPSPPSRTPNISISSNHSDTNSNFSQPSSEYGSPMTYPSSLVGSTEVTPISNRKETDKTRTRRSRRSMTREDDRYFSFDSDEENSYYSISSTGSNRNVVEL